MSVNTGKAFRLFPLFRERVWGRTRLMPYFPDPKPGVVIGEVWFTYEENETSLGLKLGELLAMHPEILGRARNARHPATCPLLVKLLFTSERLSVQVHPDDEYAEKHHGSLGKTEAWYVMEAHSGAEVALGFRERLTPGAMKAAAESGAIEGLLEWRRVRAGDAIYVPAGTVHAIGAGLTICEIQENSDITYRLFDYGRPRELHLERGAEVSHLGPYEHEAQRKRLSPWREELGESRYFRMERLTPESTLAVGAGLAQYLLLICLRGVGEMGDERFEAGQCWMVPAGNAALTISGREMEWMATYTAEVPLRELTGE